MRLPTLLLALAFGLALQAVAIPAIAEENSSADFEVDIQGSDTIKTIGMSEGALNELSRQLKGAIGASPTPPWTEVAATTYCNAARPGAADSDVRCSNEWLVCNAGRGDAPDPAGPAVNVWTRLVDDTGQPVDTSNQPIVGDGWTLAGFTCLPHLVPGAGTTITMADVMRQFHDTAFAKAQATIQPVGGTTLVNLPTYYQLTWPSDGFAPDQVDTTTLLGHQVRIKPTLEQAEYHFGDGATSGPTLSTGGPYPTGDVVHTYAQPAAVNVQIDVTYGGQFSIDGGDWIDIPGTATIPGTPTPLRVAEARARLYTN